MGGIACIYLERNAFAGVNSYHQICFFKKSWWANSTKGFYMRWIGISCKEYEAHKGQKKHSDKERERECVEPVSQSHSLCLFFFFHMPTGDDNVNKRAINFNPHRATVLSLVRQK